MTSLREVVTWLQEADERQLSMRTLCLSEPWDAEAEARVVELDEDSRLPSDALAGGLKYFLEASVAREVLDMLRSRRTASSVEEACKLLIHYAENDAYPEWVYK
jgi:hypothetical protein